MVELRVGRRTYRFAAHARRALDRAETLALLKERLERHDPPCVLFVPHVTDALARKCRELDIPIHRSGRQRLSAATGPVRIRHGAEAPRRNRTREAAARFGHGNRSSNGIRSVCRPELLNGTYRDITAATGIALGAVGRALVDLQKRGFLAGGGRGRERRWSNPFACSKNG